MKVFAHSPLYNRLMRKAACVLNAYKVLPGLENFYQRMKEELLPLGYELEAHRNKELLTYLGRDRRVTALDTENAFILYLDKDHYVSHGLEKAGFRLFDTASSIEICDDKAKTYLALEGTGIRIPKTITGPLTYSEAIQEDFPRRVVEELGLPLVAKLAYGSMGNSVFLLNTLQEVVRFERENRYMLRLYQEWIQKEPGIDYRLIVIGGKCVAAMRRENPHDFRSNLAQGGRGIAIQPEPAFVEVAEKAAKTIGLDYCGVDLLRGEDGGPFLCEVNSNAFLQGIEKATSVNVALIYARHIAESL